MSRERGKRPNSLNDEYTTQLHLPQKRYAHSAWLFEGNRLLVFGGVHRSGSGQSPFHSFYECQLQLDSKYGGDLFQWKKVHVSDAPKDLDSHSCIGLLDSLMITFGGRYKDEDVSNNDLFKFSLFTKHWTRLEVLNKN
jgi:hypothetical protein